MRIKPEKYPAIYYDGYRDRQEEKRPRVIRQLYVGCWYMAGWNDADIELQNRVKGQLTW